MRESKNHMDKTKKFLKYIYFIENTQQKIQLDS